MKVLCRIRNGALCAAASLLVACTSNPSGPRSPDSAPPETAKAAPPPTSTLQADVPEQPSALEPPRAPEQPTATEQPNPRAQTSTAERNIAPGPENGVARPTGCSVFYRYDEYAVPDEYRGVLQDHADYLKSDRRARLRVVGNADERGSREYNLALAQRRAEAVKSLLVELGVPENRVVARSNGEERPHTKGHDGAAWAGNRRSDLVYTRHRLPLPKDCGSPS